ncbi:MAG: MBL fold metallo-hydrolase [Bacillota bacterium]|nr:MBL fold metallo-hydrolase [Bacillota bacterium]
MLESSRYGEVIQLIMGREMSGQVLYRVAAYLVDGLMIDTGCSHTAEELLDFARREKIERVYLTHYHEDHIGACALLQKELEIDIYANPITISLIHTPHQLYPYQELVWGYPEAADVEPIKERKIITKNYRFEVMDTPGHSKDHTALIEPELGWCFTGDLFVSEKLKVLRPEEDIEPGFHSFYIYRQGNP